MAGASMIRMGRVIHTLQILALVRTLVPTLALSLAGCSDPPAERVVVLDLLDNGSFAERSAEGLPWWRSARGNAQQVEREGAPCLLTGPGDLAEQPIAAYAPL